MKGRILLNTILLICFNLIQFVALQAQTTYEWDANGNMTSSADSQGNSATYIYNSQNELTRVERQLSDGSTIVVSYQYDPDGNRTSKTVNGVTTRYWIDSNRPLPVVLSEHNDSGEVLVQ